MATYMANLFGEEPDTHAELTYVTSSIEDGRLYLDLVYRVENSKEIFDIHIPKAEVPLPRRHMTIRYLEDATWIELNSTDMFVHPNKNKQLFLKTIIKKKTRKMTVSEIEKALGYSVEIVSE